MLLRSHVGTTISSMTEHDGYADIAPFYDLEFDSFDDDLELYLGYVQIVGGPVLELGCGTGRLLEPIARAGVDITGLDNSRSMIEIARQRLEASDQSDRISLAQGDMRDLSPYYDTAFRLVFIAINSFLHLESRDDQLAALEEIRKVLDRDGILIIDVFNPTPETLARMGDRLEFDAEWTLESGDIIQRFSHRQIDPMEQMVTTRLFYDRVDNSGPLTRHSTSYRMRYVHRFELELLLLHSGFEIEGTYGTYSLDPIEADSEHLIIIAHRTANPGED